MCKQTQKINYKGFTWSDFGIVFPDKGKENDSLEAEKSVNALGTKKSNCYGKIFLLSLLLFYRKNNDQRSKYKNKSCPNRK